VTLAGDVGQPQYFTGLPASDHAVHCFHCEHAGAHHDELPGRRVVPVLIKAGRQFDEVLSASCTRR
jgi:hypothetical protein